ncbi:hypothetical protein [Streptomyces sp. CB03911]|uniref:hypothetical protein n=1 Tax=Streptomyces sp. CB03911 TaxID=1804758 RepID=UPI00096445F7|nr:hypothetical protein [Streptomyces sp. CB03911]OKI14245.1 hypothetical protein A6A07_13935 [Streptomyces sp. CB03911]
MLSIKEEAALTGMPEQQIRANREAGQRAANWVAAQQTALAGRPDGGTEIQYGSPEWVSLPQGDPRRAVAVIRAAEAWRMFTSDLPERVIIQVAADLAAGEANREQWFAEWNREWAEDWASIANWARGLAGIPTPAEYAAAREAVRPREVKATSGWPPIALPGRPGWQRQLVDGQQVDRRVQPQQLEVAA